MFLINIVDSLKTAATIGISYCREIIKNTAAIARNTAINPKYILIFAKLDPNPASAMTHPILNVQIINFGKYAK